MGSEDRRAERGLRQLITNLAEPRAHTAAQARLPSLPAPPLRVQVGSLDLRAIVSEGQWTDSDGAGTPRLRISDGLQQF